MSAVRPLRNILTTPPLKEHDPKNTGRLRRPTRVISVTSGKGGVGKTLTTVNFAVAARRMGYSVLIFDGDLGLANVDVVLGLQARYNIKEVLDGHVSLREIIVEGPMGIRVIPSGSGVSGLANLSFVQKQHILEQIEQLDNQADLLLIDTGAGISDNVMTLNCAAERIIVVTTPEPHAMTDAYALIKVMNEEHGQKNFSLLVNQARSNDEGSKTAERIIDVAKRFLSARIDYLGHIPSDPLVQRSVMQRRAASEQSSVTIAGQAWNQIARRVVSELMSQGVPLEGADFWQNFLRSGSNSSTVLSR